MPVAPAPLALLVDEVGAAWVVVVVVAVEEEEERVDVCGRVKSS